MPPLQQSNFHSEHIFLCFYLYFNVKKSEKKKKIEKKMKTETAKFSAFSNRCVLSTLFSTFNMDIRMDQQAYFPIEMQFYISVMFLGFPNVMHVFRF